jgi:hypothetical protein
LSRQEKRDVSGLIALYLSKFVSTLVMLNRFPSFQLLAFWLRALNEQARHPVHAPAPGGLELVEGLPGASDHPGIGAHELFPPTALLGDQTGPFQHRDVLLHRCEAHRIGPRESRNRGLAGDAAAKDVAASAVGESMEQLVNRPARQLIYNH